MRELAVLEIPGRRFHHKAGAVHLLRKQCSFRQCEVSEEWKKKRDLNPSRSFRRQPIIGFRQTEDLQTTGYAASYPSRSSGQVCKVFTNTLCHAAPTEVWRQPFSVVSPFLDVEVAACRDHFGLNCRNPRLIVHSVYVATKTTFSLLLVAVT